MHGLIDSLDGRLGAILVREWRACPARGRLTRHHLDDGGRHCRVECSSRSAYGCTAATPCTGSNRGWPRCCSTSDTMSSGGRFVAIRRVQPWDHDALQSGERLVDFAKPCSMRLHALVEPLVVLAPVVPETPRRAWPTGPGPERAPVCRSVAPTPVGRRCAPDGAGQRAFRLRWCSRGSIIYRLEAIA